MTPYPKKLKVLEKTCDACPAQWEGQTEDGERVYIRYRWGWLRLEINGRPVYSDAHGDRLDGYMTEEEMLSILKDWISL